MLSNDEVAVELSEPALSGTQLLTFESDGSVWMELNLMTVRLSGVVQGGNASTVEITQESRLDGAAAGMAPFYRRGSDSLLWIILDSNEVRQTIEMSYDGMVGGRRLRDRQTTYSGTPQTNLSDGVVSYTCHNDTLTLTLTPALPGAPPLTWRYRRL